MKKNVLSGGCSVSMVYSPPRKKFRKKTSWITFKPPQGNIKAQIIV